MTRHRKLLAITALTIAAGGGAVITHRSLTPDPADSAGRTAGSASAARGGSGAESVPAREASRAYAVTLDTNVDVGGQRITSIALRGRWMLSPVERSGGNTRYHGVLAELDVTVPTATNADARRVEELELGLSSDHFFTLTQAGELQAIKFTGTMPALAEQMLKSLMASLQFRPPPADEPAWIATETDTAGRYRAEYRRGAPGAFKKVKLEYLKTFAKAPAALDLPLLRPVVERSQHDFKFDGPLLTELTVDESLLSPARDPVPEMRATTRLSLKLDAARRVTPRADLAALEASARDARLEEPATPAAVRHDTDRARIAGMTMPQILAIFSDADDGDKPRLARAYTALAALLRQDESVVADAAARIRRGDSSAKLLVDALGDAGSSRAQETLAGIARDTATNGELRRAALVSLSFVAEPDSATFSTFEQLLEDPELGRQAHYGLGASIQHARDSQPAQAEAALKKLLAARPAADAVDATVVYLGALGNSGHAGILPEVVPFLSHQSAAVRAAAVYALRHVPGATADRYVAEVLTKDQIASVRTRAGEATRARRPAWPLVSAVTKALRSESDFKARRAALLVAIDWLPTVPSLVEALAWTETHDTEDTLRRMAGGALAGLRARG